MPNVWTHLIFGKELLTELNRGQLLSTEQTEHLFHFGCQGPDFLFYHRFLPWQNKIGLSELGEEMHNRYCGSFLMHLLQSVKGKPVHSEAVIYTLGFLTHHLLDRNFHPFVYYYSGFGEWKHQQFEIILDTLLVKAKLGKETWKTPVWRELDLGKPLPMSIAKILYEACQTFFPDKTAHIKPIHLQEAYQNMLQALRLFHDPTGIKRLVTLGKISPLVYRRTLAPLDYLNERKQVWNDPTSETEILTDSVWDLWEKALADGKQVLAAVFTYLDNPAASPELEQQLWENCIQHISEISYNTGKQWELGLEIKHVQPII